MQFLFIQVILEMNSYLYVESKEQTVSVMYY